jgi:hypothetical protein
MIEIVKKAAEIAIQKTIEKGLDNLSFKLPDLPSRKEKLNDTVLGERAEAAAYSATKFFDLPEVKIQKGDSIGVYLKDGSTYRDDVFEYNLEQFKEMNCTSFEDMTKIWAHECGHRVLQNLYTNSWAAELGADFFAGVRSEMMGLPKSNMEKHLGATKGSQSHPHGALRMKAMDYGRTVVSEMRKLGLTPTLENCLQAFSSSPFSKMTYSNVSKEGLAAFVDSKGYHLKNAADIKAKIDQKIKEAEKAASKGDLDHMD